ncbi:hypothetical protein SIN8267_00467 [Sinobacterium norvegicum]|uniref:Uncharacterized protein n=1 Tax=Sinobacterium norvegicum TaxID=1641715 RepID=A0ABM9ABM6_9GAMM|nr:hypothetical protein SIN8267_00467 [Sinobacterium norvegicum]
MLKALADLNMSATNAQRLLAGKQQLIKKDLPHKTAFAYQRKLSATGLQVVINKHRPPQSTSVSALAVESSNDSSEVSVRRSCPKCQKQVAKKAVECRHCGIFFAKFNAAQAVQQEQVPQNEQQIGQAVKAVDHPPLPWGKIIAAVVVLVVVYAGKLSLFNPPDFSLIGQSSKAQAAGKAVYQSNQLSNQKINMSAYLLVADYDALETELSALEMDYRKDIQWETAYYFSFLNLVEAGITFEMVNGWVAKTDSIYAYTARGAWFADKAMEARGSCLARCVTEQQFKDQTKYSRLAINDFNHVLQERPDMMPVYPLLIAISTARGVRVDRREVVDAAIEQNPGSYYVRSTYINKLEPRWGGSYSKMDGFAEEQQQYLAFNPKLYLLLGRSHADKAWYAKRDKQCQMGIEHMKAALEYGVTAGWAERIAWCYSGSNQPEPALEYINLSVALGETDENLRLQEVIQSQQGVAIFDRAL